MALDNRVVSLDQFRQKAEAKKPAPDERVFDRAERLIPSPDNWHDSAAALLQYIQNEWPIEKANPQRGDILSEHVAHIVIIGIFSRDQNQIAAAARLQDAFLNGCDEKGLMSARRHYAQSMDRLQAAYTGQPMPPEYD